MVGGEEAPGGDTACLLLEKVRSTKSTLFSEATGGPDETQAFFDGTEGTTIKSRFFQVGKGAPMKSKDLLVGKGGPDEIQGFARWQRGPR